jgi:cytochrome c oxidase assembly factor CtaG
MLLVPAVLYVLGWFQLRARLPNAVRVWRLGAFMSGVLLIWVVSTTLLAQLDHQFLTAHMVQHLVLMTLAAPLILLGQPAITLVHTLPRRYAQRATGVVLHVAALHGRRNIFADPLFSWFAGTVCVLWWHVPAVFALGMQSERWHEVEQITFLAAGLLFWWPVVQPWPSIGKPSQWFIPIYLFLATLPCDTLSAFLTFCDRAVYSTYVSGPELFHGSALRDQEFAGATMWVWVTFVYLIPAVVITVQRLSSRKPSWEVEVILDDKAT